jgi:hypothetical protein
MIYRTQDKQADHYTTDAVNITKNGTVEGSVYIDTEDPNICDDDYASGTTVTLAYQGDVVFIRTHETYKLRGSIQSNEYGRTSFAGIEPMIYRTQDKQADHYTTDAVNITKNKSM